MLALRGRGFSLRNRLDFKQSYRRIFRRTLFGGGLSYLFDRLRKGAGQFEPLGPALQLLAKGLTVGCTSTTGVYLNEHLLLKADASGPKSARMLPTCVGAALRSFS